MRPISRTITSLLAAAGAGFAVSAMIGAPVAVAQVCEPSQLDNNGQCTVPDKNANNVPCASRQADVQSERPLHLF